LQHPNDPAIDAGPRWPGIGLTAAAISLAMLDAASVQANARRPDGVRLVQSTALVTGDDAYQTGRGLLAAGDVTGALSAFRQALVRAPESVDVLNGLGVSYDRMGRYDLSRTYYESALAIDAGSVPVLNNLGYSLYLQKEYRAAIPILQRVVAATDSTASANARRLLTLIAAQIRNDAAAASTALAMREIAPQAGSGTVLASAEMPVSKAAGGRVLDIAAALAVPERARAGQQIGDAVVVRAVDAPRARIEQTGNGEQRLVLGGPEPDRALAASLGDAAVLVMVAPAWTARDEQALVAAEAARDRMAARAAAADLAELFPARRALEADAPVPPVALAVLSDAVSAARIGGAFPVSPAAVPAPARLPAGRRQLRAGASVADADVGTLASERARPLATMGLSGWLLADRRQPPIAEDRRPLQHETPYDRAALAFDCDDRELNAFAARMQGIAEPQAMISDAEAIARLEALLVRLRAA
jgi:Flp pilus assembly protein TadD